MRESKIENIGDLKGVNLEETERYGHLNAWKRELGISREAIETRLKGIPSILGKDTMGKVVSFYPESIVLKYVEELRSIPQVDENGFVQIGDEIFASIQIWAKKISVSESILERRLDKKSSRHARKGQRIFSVYTEAMVRSCVEKLLSVKKKSENKDCNVTLEGEECMTIFGWAKAMNKGFVSIKNRLDKSRAILVKDRGGRVRKVFPRSYVIEACEDLLATPFQADENGYFLHDGKKWGTFFAWARDLPCVEQTLRKKLQDAEHLTARTKTGHVIKNGFVSEQDILTYYSVLFENIPHMDPSGFIIKDGIRYGQNNAWAKVFGLNRNSVRRRISHLVPIYGIVPPQNQRRNIFFREEDVRESCRDLLDAKKDRE